ncbi:ribonuclease R [Calidithermus timidus]|jgi:ribonuclease R|uniref:ribonuclease R n=1 Tax=Calidithermus timidus TaxID=307124 RepID=UPI00036705EC|nr:ribonuclease R [Calidithermus timidus]
MTDTILEFLRKQPDKQYGLREIIRSLRLERAEAKESLDRLVAEGKLIETRRHTYVLPGAGSEIRKPVGGRPGRGFVAKLQVHPLGFGFAMPEEPGREDLYIPKGSLAGAWHGDRVVVVPQPPGRDRKPWGVVAEVLERARDRMTGRLDFKRGFAWLISDDPKLPRMIKLMPLGLGGLEAGARIAVKINYPDRPGHEPYGEFLEYLGQADDPQSETEAVIVKHNLLKEFSPEALAEAERISFEIPPSELERRSDFRGLNIFTIDGADAKDFDDAIHVERLPKGIFRVGVHIADVSHYVKEHSALDKDAYARATSVYLPGRVLPMLPERLSNGVCSLVPGEDRLVLSVLLDIDKDGHIRDYQLREGVIRSVARLTYNQVQDYAEGKPLPEEYSFLAADLTLLLALTKALKEDRLAHGALDFHFSEVKVEVGEEGSLHLIPIREPDARSLVEELMLLANRTVARHLFERGIPALFRVHEDPTEKAYAELVQNLARLGYKLPHGEPSPKALQEILKQAEGKPEEKVVSSLLLRSLRLARYAAENLGHFGLAAEHYLHFTSPIRRYPDLVVHRVLKALLRKRITEKKRAEWAERFPDMALHASERERAAEEAERDLTKFYQCLWAQGQVGQTFGGIVSGVTDFGVFVALENGVEGMIRLENLRDDYYHYTPDLLALVGQRSKRRIRIGDALEVSIMAANPAARQIDMEPARAEGQARSGKPAKREKPAKAGPTRGRGGDKKATRSAVGPPAKRERPDRGARATLSKIYFGEWSGSPAPERPSESQSGSRRRRRRRS